MLLSVVIPARNEAENLPITLSQIHQVLNQAGIEHELIVINDGSTDQTEKVLSDLSVTTPEIKGFYNHSPNGFGCAVRKGLGVFQGDAVAVMMADGSDDPKDLVRFFEEFKRSNPDCVFGTRFSRDSKVIEYPIHKLILNRIVNLGIQVLFRLKYNDTTNAFKLYSANTIKGLQPLISPHFNLTIELPLKAIVRGYRYSVVSNHWYGRKKGVSKLKIKEMGSRYLFIILYCFIEKWLSRGDYKKPVMMAAPLQRTVPKI